jgi:tripartite-type tricarboxylate transporter receptor subunit TctC
MLVLLLQKAQDRIECRRNKNKDGSRADTGSSCHRDKSVGRETASKEVARNLLAQIVRALRKLVKVACGRHAQMVAMHEFGACPQDRLNASFWNGMDDPMTQNSITPASCRSVARRKLLKTGLAAAAAGVAMPAIGHFSSALAAWPERQIRLLVPFGPGGPVDVIARLLAPHLSNALGGNVFVENRPGAAGNIGVGMAARAEPDGYTVLVTSVTMVINPMLYASVPYDPVKDFTPLVDLAGSPTAYAVQPSLGVSTIADFVALAKQRAGKLNYASSGFATPAHLAGEFFKRRAGIEMTHVPYNGGGPAVQALLGGSVELVSTALPGAHPHLVSGTLKGLALTGEKRWFDLPNVPTMVEAGYPGFVLDTWTAMLVPAKTPPEIASRLSKETIAVLKQPEFAARLRPVGLEPTAGDGDALRARIARELPLWGEIVKQAGIQPQ